MSTKPRYLHIQEVNERTMEEKRLCRSGDRMVAGVCSGLAKYFGIDPVIVRIIFVLLSLPTVVQGALIYVAFWIVMPECEPGVPGTPADTPKS
jgi:phage shock protein C